MTLDQLFDVTDKYHRWIINEGTNSIYVGYRWNLRDDAFNLEPRNGDLYEQIKDREIEHLTFHIDISHKKWKEKGLMKPLMPEETPQYSYSDLQETVYYEVHLKGKEQEQ